MLDRSESYCSALNALLAIAEAVLRKEKDTNLEKEIGRHAKDFRFIRGIGK